MHTDGLVLLAVATALLAALFIVLTNILRRVERIERRLYRSPRKKKASQKKD